MVHTADSYLELWWQAVKPHLLIDKAAWLAEASKWRITPYFYRGQLSILFLEDHGEVHIVKIGNLPFTRSQIRSALREGMTTRVPKEDSASDRFIRRIGFELVDSDEHDNFYRLETIRHV